MNYFDETLKDWVRTQQAGLGTTKSVQKFFNRRNKLILEMIGEKVSPRNVASITKRIKELDAKTQKRFLKLIEAQLADVANITVRNESKNVTLLGIHPSSKSLSTVSVLRKSLNTPMVGTNKTVKNIMNDVFKGSTEAAQNIIRRSVTEGLTGFQVRRILRQRFGVESRYLESATATAMNSVANQARDKFYQDNSDVIDSVMWRSTLDSRTSNVCQSLDGKVWKVTEPHPTPPAHPNCRSFLVPVVKGATVSETRKLTRPAVVDGKASRVRVETYGEWLGRQTKGFQEQVLGIRRTELFREGEISFSRFFTKDGKALTIKQLEQIT